MPMAMMRTKNDERRIERRLGGKMPKWLEQDSQRGQTGGCNPRARAFTMLDECGDSFYRHARRLADDAKSALRLASAAAYVPCAQCDEAHQHCLSKLIKWALN